MQCSALNPWPVIYSLYFNHEQSLSRDISLLTFIDKTNIILLKVLTVISVRELLNKHFLKCAWFVAIPGVIRMLFTHALRSLFSVLSEMF